MPDAPLVIVNPTAGGGRAARTVRWLRQRLEFRPDARLVTTVRRGDAESLAAEAHDRGHDRVIAVGGDGTVQEVVNGLCAGRGMELGIVPVGTGNDLARSLGLPRDPAEAWNVAIGRSTTRVDAAIARRGDGTARWFASAGGIGFDGRVASVMAGRRGWRAARTGYLATALVELWRYSNRRVELAIDGEVLVRDVLLVAIANGAYYGGGMHIAPGARPDDGRLDLCVVSDISHRAALRQIPNLYRGTHVRHPTVSMHTAAVVEADGDAGTLVHLDGEPFGGLPLRVEIASGALTVAVVSASQRAVAGVR